MGNQVIVIGYKSYFSEGLINFHKLDTADLIGGKFEYKTATFGDKLIENEPNDIVEELIFNNYGICTEFDKATSMATVIFKHEIPLEFYKQYYDNEPIIKINMIEINDELTCINSKVLDGNDVAPSLIEGDKYTAKEIYICGCGKQHIGVGLPVTLNWVKCYHCSEEMPLTTHWCHPSRFTK